MIVHRCIKQITLSVKRTPDTLRPTNECARFADDKNPVATFRPGDTVYDLTWFYFVTDEQITKHFERADQ